MLALRDSEKPSPFLWAKGKDKEPWDSARLSRVLKREFSKELQLPITLSVYRHLAIAISRKHLPCGGFKRDYEREDTGFNSQSAHSSWTAGSIYARGLHEAAGHVEERKSQYRAVSREWHEFLGFLPSSLPPRKRPLSEILNQAGRKVKRRATDKVPSIAYNIPRGQDKEDNDLEFECMS